MLIIPVPDLSFFVLRPLQNVGHKLYDNSRRPRCFCGTDTIIVSIELNLLPQKITHTHTHIYFLHKRRGIPRLSNLEQLPPVIPSRISRRNTAPLTSTKSGASGAHVQREFSSRSHKWSIGLEEIELFRCRGADGILFVTV